MQEVKDLTALTPSQISFGVAVIPSNPISQQVSRASLAIARLYDSTNIIDNQKFPAHVSLYLGGNDPEELSKIGTTLEAATSRFISITLHAERLYASHGFIGIDIRKDEQFIQLFNAVFGICADLHKAYPRYRPHLIERWPRMRKEQQELIRKIGTYKTVEAFDPHLSVAQVDPDETPAALEIARKNILLPQDFSIQFLQLVDVGHKNERWNVLHQWPTKL